MNIIEIIMAVNFYNTMFETFRLVSMFIPFMLMVGMIAGIVYSIRYKDDQLRMACRLAYIPRKPANMDNVAFLQLSEEEKIELVLMVINHKRAQRAKANVTGVPKKKFGKFENPFYFFSKPLDGCSEFPQVLIGKGSNYLSS